VAGFRCSGAIGVFEGRDSWVVGARRSSGRERERLAPRWSFGLDNIEGRAWCKSEQEPSAERGTRKKSALVEIFADYCWELLGAVGSCWELLVDVRRC
jgi:hypothetical protein